MSNVNSTSVSGGMTRINVNKFRYTWLIDNFEYWIDDGYPESSLESPQFSTQHGEVEINWNLLIFLNHRVVVNFEVCPKPELNMQNTMYFEVFLLNTDGDKVAKHRNKYPANNRTRMHDPYWIENFVNRDFIMDKRNKLLDGGVLTIVCEFFFVGEIAHLAGQTTPRTNQPISLERRLGQLDEYEQLLFSKTFSDFTLVAGGVELPVHKNILAIKSRVFAAMLEHDTADKREGRVELAGIEPDVLREMLRFVYAGKINNLEELAPGLLAAAENYELEALKTLCEEEIIENMSLDNIDEWLMITDKCHASKLKAAAMEFIKKNTEELSQSEKFHSVLNVLSLALQAEIVNARWK